PSVTARSMPGAEGWKLVDHGVRVGGPLRRVALAWALQAPGVLTLDSDTEIDWWLDPRDRTGALVPALEWRATGLALGSGEPAWILSGFATIEHAPRSTRVPLGDRTVAGMVPVAIAVVTASSGKVDLYLDPAADSVGTAWARWLGPVVGSA